MKLFVLLATLLFIYGAFNVAVTFYKGIKTAKRVFKNNQRLNWFRHYPETYCIVKEAQENYEIPAERCTSQCAACEKTMQIFLKRCPNEAAKREIS